MTEEPPKGMRAGAEDGCHGDMPHETRNHAGSALEFWLGLGTLAAWAMVLVFLLVSGRYRLYLIASLWPLLALGWVLLFVSFVARFTLGGGHGHGKTQRGTSLVVRTGILVLPLLYLASVHGESLGSYAFSKRQVLMPPDASLLSGLDALDAKEGDVVTLELPRLVWNYHRLVGGRVAVKGQVALEDSLPEGHIILFRFMINCCVADAQPAAVVVNLEGKPMPEADSWLKVMGPLQVETVGESDALVIHAESAEAIDEPWDIYLSAF